MHPSAVISARGARRWHGGHPWVFRSDVVQPPDAPPGAVAVRDQQGRSLGWALWSPASEISLRLLDRDPDAVIGEGWWHERIARSIARREPVAAVANAYRLVHGEGDGLPSLVADRFDRWVVVQLLSAGVEAFRGEIVEAVASLTGALFAVATLTISRSRHIRINTMTIPSPRTNATPGIYHAMLLNPVVGGALRTFSPYS